MPHLIARPNSQAIPLSPRHWHDSFSAPPVLSSEAARWTSALLRQWSDTSPDMEQPPLDHHFVTLHLGGAKRVTRTGEGAPVVADVALDGLSIMPAGSAFKWRTEGPIGFVHLYLTPRTIAQVIIQEFDRDYRNVSLIDRVGFDDPLLARLLRSMLDEVQLPGNPSHTLLDALLRTFVLKLVRDHSTVQARPPSARHTLAPYRLRRVLDFIDSHLMEDINLGDLATLSGSSPYHFSRGFSRATGLPPYRYVIGRRIDRAKILLLQERSLSLAEAGFRCGFNSQRQFAAMFTKIAGVSPGRFRRER